MNNINTPKYLIIHHAGGTYANPLQDSSNYTVEQCNQDHKVRFDMLSELGYYIGYHYFIDKYGLITQTRKDTEEGAHTKGKNFESLGICIVGNFDSTLPTEAQIFSLKQLIKEKIKQYNIPIENVVPHRTFAVKTCYGKLLSDDWARLLVKEEAVVITPPIVEEVPVTPPQVVNNNNFMKDTLTGSWVALAGVLVSVLAHYNIIISEDGVAAVISGIIALYGLIHQVIVSGTSTGSLK
jgi:hypothetical protein